MDKKDRRKILCYQLVAFILCYVSYSSVHMYREFWSVSKPTIEDKKDKYHVNQETLSNVDFTNIHATHAARVWHALTMSRWLRAAVEINFQPPRTTEYNVVSCCYESCFPIVLL